MDKRLEAAEMILNRGVRFRLPAPFLSRLLKLNRITIRPLKAGTIFEIARIVLEHELEDAIVQSDYNILEKAINPIARCVAVAVLNDKKKIEKRVDILQRWLLWKVPVKLMLEMFMVVQSMNRTADFMNITRYFVLQTSMMMNPNLGHQENGR